LNFKCKNCGDNRLEEVMVNVIQYTTISDIDTSDDEPIIEYGTHSLEGGEVSHYQCLSCGMPVAENEPALFKYLEENNML
jgi:hypothetical protein